MLFEVVPPSVEETCVIVEVPHAGLILDPESMSYCAAPAACIGQDADLFVDELFVDAPLEGAHLLYAKSSRYLCDLNRAEDDLDSATTQDGRKASAPHGVVWRRSTSGRNALISSLPSSEIQRRLDLCYRPYHQALRELIAQKREKFGTCILLCGHSMPSFGRLGERRADLVPGSQGRSTAAREVIDCPEKVAELHGYQIEHDAPYKGGYTTQHYGQPREGIHALQLEIARRVYMDEAALRKRPDDFENCRAYCRALVRQLGRIDVSQLVGDAELRCAE